MPEKQEAMERPSDSPPVTILDFCCFLQESNTGSKELTHGEHILHVRHCDKTRPALDCSGLQAAPETTLCEDKGAMVAGAFFLMANSWDKTHSSASPSGLNWSSSQRPTPSF